MAEISIIIPVYNVKEYLEKCFMSVQKQTFTDLEIILVDDGSTDGSGILCDQFALEDSRCKVIHKKNGGLSDARNTGISVATAPYIGFVDSDDYIEDSMFQLLYLSLIENNADMSMCGLYDVYGQRVVPQALPKKEMVMTSKEAVTYLLSSQSVGMYAVNKLYKKELFQFIRFPVGKTFEDAAIMVDILLQCSCVSVNTKPQYYYYHRVGSISQSSFSLRYYDVIEAHTRNSDLLKEHMPEVQEVGLFRIYWSYHKVFSFLALSSRKDRSRYRLNQKELAQFIRHHIVDCVKNPYSTRNYKIAFLLMAFFPGVYGILLRKKERIRTRTQVES